MKQANRTVAVAFVVGAWVITGVGAGAKSPQIRESVTVQGSPRRLGAGAPPDVQRAGGAARRRARTRNLHLQPAGRKCPARDQRQASAVRDAQHRVCVADIAEQSLRSDSRRTTDRWLATPHRGVVRTRRGERAAADVSESATLTPDTVVSGRRRRVPRPGVCSRGQQEDAGVLSARRLRAAQHPAPSTQFPPCSRLYE